MNEKVSGSGSELPMDAAAMLEAVAKFKSEWTDRQPYAPPMLRASQKTLDALAAQIPLRDEPNCALGVEVGAILHGVRIYINDALAVGEMEEWQDGKWRTAPMGL